MVSVFFTDVNAVAKWLGTQMGVYLGSRQAASVNCKMKFGAD